MLKRLYVDNYKCLVNFEFRPQRVQLLLGANGSGKSTVFEVLRVLRQFITEGRSVEHVFSPLAVTRWNNHFVQTFELEIDADGGHYQYTLQVETGWPFLGAKPRILREEFVHNNIRVSSFVDGTVQWHNTPAPPFPLDPTKSALFLQSSPIISFKEWFLGLLEIHINPWSMSPSAESESRELAIDASNFAAWYRHLLQEDPARHLELFNSLRNVIDGFQSMKLVQVGENTRVVKAAFKATSLVEGTPQDLGYGLTELSEGQRVLLVLYTLLHCALKKGGVLCIDEPDNFVALREIQPWLLELVDRANDNDSQVLLISHHPELINYLAAEHGVIFERLDGGPVRVRPFEVDADSGLSAAEIVARGWEHE